MAALEAEHVLDWFHVAMRLTVLEQYARGVAHHDEKEGARLLQELERTKWLLWHGNQCLVKQHADDLRDDVEVLELNYPHLGRLARPTHEFAAHIRSNAGSLINYGERFRAGERISSAMAENTVNAVVSKHFAKRQQMQWESLGSVGCSCRRFLTGAGRTAVRHPPARVRRRSAYPDLVPPRDVQVVLVRESGALSQLQRRQGDVGRGGRHLPRAVTPGAEAELIEVGALSSPRDLDHAVQLAQGASVRHQ